MRYSMTVTTNQNYIMTGVAMGYTSIFIKYIYIKILFVSFDCLYGQAKIWHLNADRYLDFNGSPAALVYTQNQNTFRGSEDAISMTNADGEFIFFSNGSKIWNKNFEIMPNGDDLNGWTSSTQSVLSVQFYDDPMKYYLFTNGQGEGGYINDDLYYSVVDMSLNDGLGDIVEGQKNILLYEDVTERLSMIQGPCDTIYLVFHEADSRTFVLLPLTKSGIGVPIRQSIGSFIGKNNDIATAVKHGVLRFNISGDKMGMAMKEVVNDLKERIFRGGLELYKFDKLTGEISEPILFPVRFIYEFEFSPDGTKVYAIKNKSLMQYDISIHDRQAIIDSEVEIAPLDVEFGSFAPINLGPDEKIYFLYRTDESRNIGVINNPNATGADSNVNAILHIMPHEGITSVLPTRLVTWNKSNSNISIDSSDTMLCPNSSLLLTLSGTADSYEWQDGSTSAELLVNEPGTYWVDVTQGSCTYSDTIQVTIADQSTLDIGDMILTCNTDPITLMSNIDGETYNWNTGATTPIIEVTETDSYTLEVESAEGCIYRDTIDIVFDELSIDLGADQEICIGDSTILSAPSPETLSSIVWSDGSVDPDLIVRSADSYWLAIERGMCLASDTIMISYGVCDMIPDSMMMDTMMNDTIMVDTMTIDTMMTQVPGISIPDDDCSVYIPNAISAGASQPVNRFFQIFSNCALSSINIKIYDRWGNLHYQISDTVISDDDILIQPGVYVAKVEYRFEDGDEVEQVLQSVTVL